MAVSVQDFAAKVKQKYPEYQNVDDTELTKKIVEKYPEYKDVVNFGDTQQNTQQNYNGGGSAPKPQEPDFGKMSDAELENQTNQDKANGNFNWFSGSKASSELARRKLGQQGEAQANFVTDSTLKPIAKFIAAGPVSTQRDREGFQAYTQTQGTPEQKAAAMQEAQVKPFNLPFLGNVNAYQGQKDVSGQKIPGKMDVGKSFANAGGNIADAGMGVMNLMNPLAKSFVGAFGRGALQAGAKEIQNEDATPTSVGINAGVGGAMAGAFQQAPKVLNFLRNWRADKMGINDIAKETLLNPQNADALKKEIDYAKQTASDVLAPKPMEKAGADLTNDYLNPFKKYKSSVGAKIDPFIQAAPKIKTTVPVSDFKNSLIDDVGVKIAKDGKLDFSTSKIASDENGQREIQKLWSKFFTKKGTAIYKELPATEVRNSIMDISKNILDLHPQAPGKVGNISQVPIAALVEGLDTNLKSALPPEAHSVYDEFKQLATADNFLSKKIGGSKNSASMLKALYGDTRSPELLPALQTMGKVTGKNYINESNIARTASDAIKEGKSSGFKEDILRMFLKPKQGAAMGLIKQGQGQGMTGLPQKLLGRYNALPIAVQDYLNNLLQGRTQQQQ